MPTLWNRRFVLINIINFLMYLSYNMINPSLPVYLQGMGISQSVIGMVVAMFTVGSVCTRPLAGNIVDRFGRRQVFLLTLVILSGLVFSYSLIVTVALLFVLRMVHGFSWGFASTASATIATDAIPRQHLGKGMGYFGVSMGVSIAIAPGLALGIYKATSYQTMMRVSMAIVLVALILAVLYPYSSENLRKEKSSIKTGSFSLEPCAILPALIVACATQSMSSITAFVSLYAASIGIDNIGIYFAIYATGLVIARPVMGNLIDKINPFAIALPCYGLMCAALVLISCAQNLPTLMIAGFCFGFGYGGGQTSVQTMAITAAPRDHYGAANGTYFIGFDLGIGVGAMLAGSLAGAVGYRLMYRAIALVIALGMALLCYHHARQKRAAINN